MRKTKWWILFPTLLSFYASALPLSLGSATKNPSTNVQYVDVVTVTPGADLQELVAQHPPGTTFIIQAGTHRLQEIKPKAGDRFVGKPGAILSGARVIDNFIRKGNYWVADVAVPSIPQKGKCEKQQNGMRLNACQFANDLFFNDQSLIRVMSLSDVEPGKWFFDSKNNKLYISDNPTDKVVEISMTRYAIFGSSNNVAIRNLIIEKYANPAQEGAIHPLNAVVGALGKNWEIDGNEIRFNHGRGIRLGHRMRITNNNIHHNGQLGIGGAGNAITIEGNEIAYNNTHGFDSHWEAGGTKFSHTKYLTVKGNFVHHNNGPGLWTDGHNIHTLYEGNKVFKNAGPGIFHEISYEAVIKDNIVEQNGFEFTEWTQGAGILISASPNVEVYGNTVKNNRHGICGIQTSRGSGKHGPYETENLYVHDNNITMETGETGLSVKSKDVKYFTSRKNRFQNNDYTFIGKKKKYFRWKNAIITGTQWKNLGQDLQGSFTHID